MQKTSIDFLETVNIAQDIVKELKLLRQNAKHEFHQLYSMLRQKKLLKPKSLLWKCLTSRMTNRCNIAAATDEDYFRAAIFIPFLGSFILTLESRFSLQFVIEQKTIIGGFQCLIPANPTVGPAIQQTERIQVLGKVYENDLTKSPEDLAPELTLWFRKKLSRLDAAKRPTDALNSIKECRAEAFSNILTLLTILSTLPVSTCTGERSFSTLCRLKTYLQNTTGTTRMNGLAMLNIYRNHTPCPEEVVNRMSEANSRLPSSL